MCYVGWWERLRRNEKKEREKGKLREGELCKVTLRKDVKEAWREQFRQAVGQVKDPEAQASRPGPGALAVVAEQAQCGRASRKRRQTNNWQSRSHRALQVTIRIWLLLWVKWKATGFEQMSEMIWPAFWRMTSAVTLDGRGQGQKKGSQFIHSFNHSTKIYLCLLRSE